MWRRNLLARVAISRDLCSREPVIRSPFVDRWKKSMSASSDVQEAATEAFVSRPTKGLVYGRLNQLGKNTLKTDLIHFFDGCNLSISDIRFEYNRLYNPLGAVLQFSSVGVFDAAVRLLIRKGRLYRLEKVDRSQWDLLKSYDGKAVLLQGIPRNALFDDVERFLSGCNFNSSSIQMFLRAGFPDPVKMAIVQFPTQSEATNAFRTKNRAFASIILLRSSHLCGLCCFSKQDVPFEVFALENSFSQRKGLEEAAKMYQEEMTMRRPCAVIDMRKMIKRRLLALCR